MDKGGDPDHSEPLNYRKMAADLRKGGRSLEMLEEDADAGAIDGAVSLL